MLSFSPESPARERPRPRAEPASRPPEVSYLAPDVRGAGPWPEPPELPSRQTEEPQALLRDWERLRQLDDEQRGE
jgi:hypothetical protein